MGQTTKSRWHEVWTEQCEAAGPNQAPPGFCP